MKYAYDEQTLREVERMLRYALPSGTVIKATLEEDFGGVDLHFVANHHCPVQVRCRFNRPAMAADIDVSFRSTEPKMMAERTYAPLMMFLWFRKGYAEAGKLVDVYAMYARSQPPLEERPLTSNGDGTSFCTVTISELFDAQALLRHGGRDGWATSRLGGMQRVERIMAQWQ
jgi:hypothetical protein